MGQDQLSGGVSVLCWLATPVVIVVKLILNKIGIYKALGTFIAQYIKRFNHFLTKFYGRYGDLTKQYEIPFFRMLHDILEDNHIQ